MTEIQLLKEKVKDLKLLFVDDEEAIRVGTGTFLKKFFNEVFVCANGEEGLEVFLKQGDFDVVVTDILMPKMDGISMVKEMKKSNPNIYVIFLTASRNTQDIEKELGHIILQKPLSFENITIVMKELGEM